MKFLISLLMLIMLLLAGCGDDRPATRFVEYDGTKLKSYVSDDVDFAIYGVSKKGNIGTNQYLAVPQGEHLVVETYVVNNRKEPIKMSHGDVVRLVDKNGAEYATSGRAMVAWAICYKKKSSASQNIFNPGLGYMCYFTFDVPKSFDVASASLKARAGIKGKWITIPLKVEVQK